MTDLAPDDALVPTGLSGLDEILRGGLPPHQTYLIHGMPGTGKTTLGLHFAMEGVRRREKALYVSNCETPEQIRFLSDSHGFDLEGVDVRYLDTGELLGEESEQSLFAASEFAFPLPLDPPSELVEPRRPDRLVLDSLTELRLLAAEPRAFRRELLSLTRKLSAMGCASLFFDDAPKDAATLASVVSGLVELEQASRSYGSDRRRLRVRKLRGRDFRSGYHDFRIRRGGIDVFPRLVQDEAPDPGPRSAEVTSGNEALDELLGGGVVRGSSVLLQGSAGSGKSTLCALFASTAAARGEASTFCVFDESTRMLLDRASSLGIGLSAHVDDGTVDLWEVDPAELTPGEFSHRIRQDVEERGVRLVVIDSLSGYLHAMDNQQVLLVHLHELLGYLGSRGVTVLMVVSQHGGFDPSPPSIDDLSYVSDVVLLLRHFEFAGEVRQCISVYKNRGGDHERSIREMRLGPTGIHVGEPLRSFQGVLRGMPQYVADRIPAPDEESDR